MQHKKLYFLIERFSGQICKEEDICVSFLGTHMDTSEEHMYASKTQTSRIYQSREVLLISFGVETKKYFLTDGQVEYLYTTV